MPIRSTFEISTQIILIKIDGFLKGWILNITPLKNFLRGWLSVLGIKEGLVECATVCVKSVVIQYHIEHNMLNVNPIKKTSTA